MSGLIAICGPRAERMDDVAEIMLARLRHRGPDVARIHKDAGVLLGYVGKTCGDAEEAEKTLPPVKNDSATITCDAEIYNSEAILSEKCNGSILSQSGRAILRVCEQGDSSFPKLLSGPFSFVIHNRGRILASRDPLGIAPLYQGDRDGLTLYASELKALYGVASNVREFPNGQLFDSDSGFSQYYKVEPKISAAQTVESVCQRLRGKLEKAVEVRVNCGSGKKGVFLSGGIDSSVIAALVNKFKCGVDSFTVGMKSSEDIPYARKVANHLVTNHHEYQYGLDEVLEILPKVIYHLENFDAPLVRSSIANYIASREAKKHVDTILIGEGGDENFGGYHHVKRFVDHADQQKEFFRLLMSLHNMGFMRTDRMNWAHSLGVRAPFFDAEVVELAFTIHPKWKIYGNEQVEKWILRKAFEDLLPREVVWRPKKQFARGSGSDDLLTRYAETEVSDETFATEKARYPEVDLRWKEEMLYFNIFKEHFGDDPATLATVGRWYE
jgi:asparagine synthase (glutamine-hydrolysing)